MTKLPGILTDVLGASNAGPSLGYLDSTYLKLDTSNDPLTGELVLSNMNATGISQFADARITSLTVGATNGFLKADGLGDVSAQATIDISDDTNLGASSPVTLTGDTLSFDFSVGNAWTGDQLFGTDTEIQFRSTSNRIWSSAANRLDIDAGTTLSLRLGGTEFLNANATDVDFYKPIYVQGTATGSSATLTLNPTIPDSVGTTVNLMTALPFYTPASGSTFNGLNFLCLTSGSNAITAWNGVYAIAAMGTYGGTCTELNSFRSNPILSNGASTYTTVRHFYAAHTGGATIGTQIGLDVELLTGTTTYAIRTAANRCLFGGEVEIDGALNHDGSTVGFFGVTPAARAAAYNVTNLVTDRSYNANATTVAELADVLGTLIADLRTYGLVQ